MIQTSVSKKKLILMRPDTHKIIRMIEGKNRHKLYQITMLNFELKNISTIEHYSLSKNTQ